MRRAEAHRQEADHEAAHELVLYIENESDLSPDGPRGQGHDVLLNALRKWRSGTYDPKLAVRLFEYLAESGAKRYAKEFGSSEREWSTMFTPATRREAASQLEESFRSAANHGEYDHVDTGRGSGARPRSLAAPRARRDIQVGDTVRFTSKFLRNTGQYTGHDAHGRWKVLEIRGSFAFVNQASDPSYFTPEELQADPMLKWRAINIANLEVA